MLNKAHNKQKDNLKVSKQCQVTVLRYANVPKWCTFSALAIYLADVYLSFGGN